MNVMTTIPQPIISSTIHVNHYNHLLTTLSASSSLSHLKQIHARIIRSGLDRSNSLLIKLVITACTLSSPSFDYALSVFYQMHNPEPHLSNKLLRELSRSTKPEKALLAYAKMREKGFVIDSFSLPPLLKASMRVQALSEGMELHGFASKMDFVSDPFVQTGLVAMYSVCGHIEDARLMFDKMPERDIVAWNSMIDGYCVNGRYNNVLPLIEEMKRSNVKPDEKIFSTVVSACARAGNLEFGKAFHGFITENKVFVDYNLQCALVIMYACCSYMDMATNMFKNLSPTNIVVSTAMITGYSKAGQVDAARLVFDQMTEKDLICWSAMITGYAEGGQPRKALQLFDKMLTSGVKPDQVTMLSVISACASLGAVDNAIKIQSYIDENRFSGVLPVNNALIDMYAKCGELERAKQVFARMHKRNVITWSSMIGAYAVHGDAINALDLFHEMKSQRVEPNGVTFVGLLYACSHAGLVEEGRKIFASMVNDYDITPKREHYGCMVDLYGRANLLKEALEVIEQMPVAPNVVIWGSLMAACRIYNEIELGEFAAKRVLELDPYHDGAHIFLSNVYAKERKWESVGEIRKLMQNKGVVKQRGCSRIELDGEIHEFLTADKNHAHVDEIYEKLDVVVKELEVAGYTPNMSCVLVDLDEDEKTKALLWHSEKLALCFGLLRQKRGSCIRVIKNLRVCEDCHNFMKLASKVYGIQILVRDRTRFHQYEDGLCSCKDYW
ncbi:putative tetratricopeptide-like helical domain superfamily, DYW domain-containing protein [Helianthus annuus]|uniref:Putative tetratricopeptide-like helical domain, DYW domain protein n=1 Tax=Helianthus annuus TaxID=4232 RepID=A0A251VD77_HELAN|nr:pentatricopeptide repeat-containing protein At4g14820 [Helianthus annuus]XP_022012978.1 pentatricopeptide repeat-containing protein At4g14820 [Helianthus annuus]KAF5817352.1 putative tetratricopeptide-like helical domain superfamily, DYW domain-containing protein [Helianthus annuus]KAJ0776312.1 putative tetratricopeptide-like helical domain superfamily, DYW domain-containing protein [Helianthus annuus]